MSLLPFHLPKPLFKMITNKLPKVAANRGGFKTNLYMEK
ncbi:hypothetical protein JCM19239_7405 [Vibrio variabilis]|uniref:Uncharacterized protein n=1 Tax=Vibrio variabilis TaxID=990271 RepID=A0ABQ0JP38_9VIBR|nr:hypothetical protein JCM19239_7405 [Vibrio variabilis]